MPICGANWSTPHRIGLPAHHEQPYPQLVLKSGLARGEPLPGTIRTLACTEIALEIGKAATLVTLQPSAPAREPTAWMHAPSQPLMRSPLSRVQNPNCSSQKQSVFSGLVAPQVTLTSRSLSLLQTGKVYFANPFSRRRDTN
jgi:hypothetical protein